MKTFAALISIMVLTLPAFAQPRNKEIRADIERDIPLAEAIQRANEQFPDVQPLTAPEVIAAVRAMKLAHPEIKEAIYEVYQRVANEEVLPRGMYFSHISTFRTPYGHFEVDWKDLTLTALPVGTSDEKIGYGFNYRIRARFISSQPTGDGPSAIRTGDWPSGVLQAERPQTTEKSVAPSTNAVTATADRARSALDSVFQGAKAAVIPGTQPAPEAVATPTPSQALGVASPAKTGLAGLSQNQMVQGLKEALGNGLQQAIARLGHDGGFLTNLNVKIPLPEKLRKVEATLRAIRQDKLADDFVATMNHAAEQAVPEAGSVFAGALKQMTIEDAKSILLGSNDAATKYFQKTTQTNLYARFYPIVQKATEQTGVTAAYKNLVEKANVTKSFGAFGSALGGAFLDQDSLDVDAYVTNKAMDGLFKMVAEEEKRIRQNPVARTTDLLQRVFGALKK